MTEKTKTEFLEEQASSANSENPGNPSHFVGQMSVEDWRKGLLKFAEEHREVFRRAMAEFKKGE